eukprot:TRINITY_DN7334_c0_g1_i1.p2 TRINITY_DN7334_c0_g1~~TRINITY_DN7334_c0_g1_i1.p2  ORF type:complete len:367 (-),score=164.15 TRINITY_DN7334_c0_g1_i1:73-1173(-)
MSSSGKAGAPQPPAYPIKLSTKSSASMVANNLTVSKHHLAYSHGNKAILIEHEHNGLLGDGKLRVSRIPVKSADVGDLITQVKYCRFSFGTALVMTSQHGFVHMYDEAGLKLLNYFQLPKPEDSSQPTRRMHGIASDGVSRLIVGSSTGELYVFTAQQGQISLDRTLSSVHKTPVYCISTSADFVSEGVGGDEGGGAAEGEGEAKSNVFCSVDDEGQVAVWDLATLECKHVFRDKNKQPAYTLAVFGNWCIVGTSTGHVRFYNLAKNFLQMEVAAHSRLISAMDIDAAKRTLVTASEDTWVNVFRLPSKASPKIESLLSKRVPSCILTGVALCGKDKSLIGMTAYDTRYLRVMPLDGGGLTSFNPK